MSDHFQALRLFVSVARTGSFSRAAREMSLSQPTASRLISALEQHVGTTLVLRTTRAVTLTDAGKDYLASVQNALDLLDEADHAVRGSGELRGRVRIAASSAFASFVIVPRLSKFMAKFPALRVELIVDDHRQDLIAEGVDVAIRFGQLTDSTAIARLLGRWSLMIAAAPAYLAREGQLKIPGDLSTHKAILSGPAVHSGLTFKRDGEEVSTQLDGNLSITASQVGIDAALAGLGVIVASSLSLRDFLQNGELVQVLPDWHLQVIECHALFPTEQAPKPAARALVEFLQQELRELSNPLTELGGG